jgi:RNA polymerase-binding protein DksA
MLNEKDAKAKLISMRDELRSRRQRLGAHQHRREQPLDPDFEEQAVEQQNDEVVNALDGASYALLLRIEKALKRIESGEYAYCEECGEPIGEQRLAAIPYTDHCIDCAEQRERR